MHLTFHTNSRGCWKPRLATHIFSPSVSLCCSLRLNWSSRSDNLALSVLISSQACLSVTDWSQMALLRGDNSSFYQTGPQQHANLKTLNLKSRWASWKWLCDVKEIMDLSTWMLPGRGTDCRCPRDVPSRSRCRYNSCRSEMQNSSQKILGQ